MQPHERYPPPFPSPEPLPYGKTIVSLLVVGIFLTTTVFRYSPVEILGELGSMGTCCLIPVAGFFLLLYLLFSLAREEPVPTLIGLAGLVVCVLPYLSSTRRLSVRICFFLHESRFVEEVERSKNGELESRMIGGIQVVPSVTPLRVAFYLPGSRGAIGPRSLIAWCSEDRPPTEDHRVIYSRHRLEAHWWWLVVE